MFTLGDWLLPLVLATADLESPAFEEASTDDPRAREELRQALETWRQGLELGEAAAPVISEEAREQLRREGYWVPPETSP